MEPVPWSRFAEGAPDLAETVAARFAAHPHHVLGTVRPSGAPRLSGINVMIDDGELWIGSMPEARKAADLRRDDRCALHSAPLDETLATPDVRVDARADVLDREAAQYWMEAHAPRSDRDDAPEGDVFFLRINAVSVTTVEGEILRITLWRPDAPVRVIERR
jgi:hypothetical protein